MTTDEHPRIARSFRVEGRVQGVFYRASAHAEAARLGLVGWVRNLPDGAVEVLACGTVLALDTFEAWLWRGPERAIVTAVLAVAVPMFESASFEIRR
ncbi:MAG: acylphosphatase [Gammaproteobacteria bacterium]|nr:acylphosphatase [Gammaproteobacteria bacterium]